MIIQGSNNPLVIQFDTVLDGIPTLIVSMWNDRGGDPVKTWTEDDMTIDGDTVVCPLQEIETSAFTGSKMVIEAKGLDADGNTVFWDACDINIKNRRDRNIRLTQTEG